MQQNNIKQPSEAAPEVSYCQQRKKQSYHSQSSRDSERKPTEITNQKLLPSGENILPQTYSEMEETFTAVKFC